MLTTALLFALAVTPLAGGAAPPAVAVDGRVAMPEGIRFRLPSGFGYRVEATEAGRTYVAESRDQGRVVAVTAARSDTALPCEAAQEGATVRAHRTEHGLRACVVSGAAPDGAGAMTLAFLKRDAVLVTVLAVATVGSADDLARAVVETVEVDDRGARAAKLRVANVPRADPRLLGCFEQSRSIAAGSSSGSVLTKRCFHEELSFEEFTRVLVATPSGVLERNNERQGAWLYVDGTLSVQYDDGTTGAWDIVFSDSNASVLASGTPWERLADEP